MGPLQLRTAAHHSTRRALGVVAALQPPRAYAYACMLRYGSSSSTCTGARCARAHVTKTNQQDHTPRLHRICFNNGGGAAGEWVHHDHESPAVYVRRVFRLVIVDQGGRQLYFSLSNQRVVLFLSARTSTRHQASVYTRAAQTTPSLHPVRTHVQHASMYILHLHVVKPFMF